MCARLAFGIAVASLMTIDPAAAQFRVCNRATERMDVAFGYFGGRAAGWIGEGWWTIGIGNCVVVHGQQLSNRYYYLYAEGGSGSEWTDPQGVGFCITRKKFKLFQSRYGSNLKDDCKKHNLESKLFLKVDTGDHRTWIQSLTSKPDSPAPQPAPPKGSPRPPPSKAPTGPPPATGSACERFPNLC